MSELSPLQESQDRLNEIKTKINTVKEAMNDLMGTPDALSAEALEAFKQNLLGRLGPLQEKLSSLKTDIHAQREELLSLKKEE